MIYFYFLKCSNCGPPGLNILVASLEIWPRCCLQTCCTCFHLNKRIQRRYSQMQSPGSSTPDFIKDNSFVLISCQSGSYDLGKEICSLIGLHFFLSLGRASFYFIFIFIVYVLGYPIMFIHQQEKWHSSF